MTATVGNIVGMTQGAKKYREGKRMMNEAQKLIDEFEWQNLEDDQVSTLGSDLRREESMRSMATTADVIRSGGTRAIVGGMGAIQAQNNIVNREIGADLDAQQKALDARNTAMIEQRQAGEIAGYGNMYNVGMGLKYGGIADYVSGAQAQSSHVMEVFSVFKGGQSPTGATKSNYGQGSAQAMSTQPNMTSGAQSQGREAVYPQPQQSYQSGWNPYMTANQGMGNYNAYNYNPNYYGYNV